MNEAALLFTLGGLTLVAAVVVLMDKFLSPDPESENWEQS